MAHPNTTFQFEVGEIIARFIVPLLLIAMVSAAEAQTMTSSNAVKINHIDRDLSVSDLANPAWGKAGEIKVATYWSGKAAPAGRHFKARLLWSRAALYVRFDAERREPLVVDENPDLARKTLHLWDRDVCEIFIAPDRTTRGKYFEFEVAPTGEWVDLAIEVMPEKRLTDLNYASGMQAAAKVEGKRVVLGLKIPWAAFGKTPNPGEVWLGNIFRCVGKDPNRGYLAWRPTMTERPDFHVPEAFGEFRFTH